MVKFSIYIHSLPQVNLCILIPLAKEEPGLGEGLEIII